jgi:phenylpyruvate tautomerase PptA (4-oxalocrotonate tautomerase family)
MDFPMPLVRISVPQSTTTKDVEAVSQAVHQALVAHCTVPLADKFHLVQRHAPDELICTPAFLEVTHTRHVVMVQILLSVGRSLEAKKALYARIAQQIADTTSFAAGDVIINLSETTRDNWSFGNGIAQYAA